MSEVTSDTPGYLTKTLIDPERVAASVAASPTQDMFAGVSDDGCDRFQGRIFLYHGPGVSQGLTPGCCSYDDSAISRK